MKAILGSAVGGVVAGAVALVASAQGRAPEARMDAPGATASPYAMTVADTRELQRRSADVTGRAVRDRTRRRCCSERLWPAGGRAGDVRAAHDAGRLMPARAMAPYGGPSTPSLTSCSVRCADAVRAAPSQRVVGAA